MRKRFGKAILLLPLLASFGLTAGEIKGIVRDETNAPIEGAVVSATSAALPKGATTSTEADGRYRIPNVPAGDYTVVAKFGGSTSEATVTVAADGTAPEVALKVSMEQAMAQATTYEITGTRIRTVNQTAVSPVATIGQTEIRNQGSTRIEDVVNSMPQAFTAQGANISNGSNGTAGVNLRGLGSARSLVLIDGRRLGPGNPNSGGAVFGDLNFIPSSLIERVDVLTGGASAVYGADAVAGVVNFITKKDFQGVQLDLDWGMYQHSQHSTEGQAAISERLDAGANPAQFVIPGDKWNIMYPSVSLTVGASTKDGKGNVTAYASYRHDEPILQADRDFSACTLNSGDTFSCGGSGTSSPARVGSFVVSGNTFIPRVASRDVYNFGPTNYYMRPDDRYNLGAFAHYELAPWADVYTQAMFLDDRSVYQIAPGGIFASRQTINCDNPFMTDAQAAQLGCAIPRDPTQFFTGTVAKRNVEGGGRQGAFHHSAYRYLMGLKGDVATNWNYDASMSFMATDFAASALNFFQSDRIANALIAKPNPAGSGLPPVCQSVIDGTDTACIPYNIFEEGQILPASDPASPLNYLQVPGYTGGYASERVVNLNLSGDLGAYGVTSPWAKQGVGVSAGGEYRHQSVSFYADFLSSSGLLSGSGGAAPPIDRSFKLFEGFAETRIPLIQNRRFVKNMALEAAYRYSNYDFGKDTHTFKVGGEWEWYDDMRFRASYQRAVRAPSLGELYAPQVVGLDGGTDPCSDLPNTLEGNIQAQVCANSFFKPDGTAFVAADFANGAVEGNPAQQYNGQFAGLATLEPELSDTVSFGFVLQPDFLPGLSVSLDYFNINVDKAIGIYGADFILNRCLEANDSSNPFCQLVHRDVDGSIWLSEDGYVIDANKNLGSVRTSGIDFNFDYSLAIGNMGKLNFAMNSTWLDTLITKNLPDAGSPSYDCAGLYGTICLAPSPEWRHKLRGTWATPIGLDVSAQWRFLSAVGLDANNPQPELNNPDLQVPTDLLLGARNYLDLVASYTLKETYTFRVGVNNVLDTDPPLSGQDNNTIASGGNGNSFPQVYDSLGRYIFFSGTAKF